MRRAAMAIGAASVVAACGFGVIDPGQRRGPLDGGGGTPDPVPDAGEVDAGVRPGGVVLRGLFARLVERYDCGLEDGDPCGRYELTFTVDNRGESGIETMSSLQVSWAGVAAHSGLVDCSAAPWLVEGGGEAEVAVELVYLGADLVRLGFPCGGPESVDLEVAGLPGAPDFGLLSVRATGRLAGGAPWGAEATGNIADLTP